MRFILVLMSEALHQEPESISAFLVKSTNRVKCFFIEYFFFLVKMILEALEGTSKIMSCEKSAFY